MGRVVTILLLALASCSITPVQVTKVRSFYIKAYRCDHTFGYWKETSGSAMVTSTYLIFSTKFLFVKDSLADTFTSKGNYYYVGKNSILVTRNYTALYMFQNHLYELSLHTESKSL